MNQQTTQSTIVATIGRDNDGVELPAEDWQNFQQRTAGAIANVGGNIVFRPSVNARRKGDGVWQGVTQEESAAFVALVPTSRLHELKNRLRAVAAAYGQEAIGFIVAHGTENLIYTVPQSETA